MEVDTAHYVVYRIVLPFFIALGILINGSAIVVLARPRLRSARVNRYFLLLAISDLMVCFFYIPVATTITGCVFNSYTEAFYYAHFGWTFMGVSQALGTYIIVWLALDRFMAVWMYQLYPRLQKKPNVLRNRMIVTAITSFFSHLAYMIKAAVVCTGEDPDDAECADGEWDGITGYEYDFTKTWHKVYRVFFGLYVRWIPSVLMVVFNVGMIVAVVKGRVRHPKTQGKAAGRSEKKLIFIMIAITASYILFTLPITLYIMVFAKKTENRCGGEHPQEVLRGVGNVFQLIEHIIHVLFLVVLNHGFKQEIKIMMGLVEAPARSNCAYESRSNTSMTGRTVVVSPGAQHIVSVPTGKPDESATKAMLEVDIDT